MRTLLLLLFVFSFHAYADDEFDTRLAGLQKEHETQEFQLRNSFRFNGKYPHDTYPAAFEKLKIEQLDAIKKLHENECRTNNKRCLSPGDIKLREAQTRIAVDLVKKRNQWAKEGIPQDEVTKREEEFNRQSRVDVCAESGKECDKVPEADKSEVVIRKPSADKDERPEGTEVAATLEDSKKAAERKLEEELTVLQKDYESKFGKAQATLDNLNAFKALEAIKLEKTLTLFAELCIKFPDKAEVCLTDDQKNQLKDASLGRSCLMERKHQQFGAADKSKIQIVDPTKHDQEWEALPSPKDCKVLLEKDKKPSVPETAVVEENDDEKSPRNYEASTCKWVSDLPRKIVNGPGCSKTSRSRICTGYVVCNQKEGNGKFIRMSSCRSEFCGNGDNNAVRCTKDQGYFSERPSGEGKLFMSQRLKKILSGASEQ